MGMRGLEKDTSERQKCGRHLHFHRKLRQKRGCLDVFISINTRLLFYRVPAYLLALLRGCELDHVVDAEDGDGRLGREAQRLDLADRRLHLQSTRHK